MYREYSPLTDPEWIEEDYAEAKASVKDFIGREEVKLDLPVLTVDVLFESQ